MSEDQAPEPVVEHLAVQRSSIVTDELNKILRMLQEVCPDDADIRFEFDGRLHVHIDVHRLEDLVKVEGFLPILGSGLFHSPMRGATPHHSFMHRLSAVVER